VDGEEDRYIHARAPEAVNTSSDWQSSGKGISQEGRRKRRSTDSNEVVAMGGIRRAWEKRPVEGGGLNPLTKLR